jgi:hypothetical protein
MKENNSLEKQFKESLKDIEAGPPDGAKGAIEKSLIDSGLLKEKNEGRGGLWIIVLLAFLVAAPVIYLLKKNHKHTKQLTVHKMLKDSTNTATKNTENKSITYKDGKESAVVTEKETAESNNDPNTVRLEDKKKEGPFLTSEINLSEDGKIKSKDKDRSPKKSNPRNEVNIKNGNTESAKALPVGIDELKTERDRAGGKIDTAKNDTGFAISSGIAAPSLGNNLAKLDTSEEARQNKESTKNDSTALLKNKARYALGLTFQADHNLIA